MWVFKGYFKYHSISPYGTYPSYILFFTLRLCLPQVGLCSSSHSRFFVFYKHIIAAAGLFFIVMEKTIDTSKSLLGVEKGAIVGNGFSGIFCKVL